MAIHNWIRCHWRNGRHVLHDVPDSWSEEIEAHLKRHRAHVRDLGRVRTASLDAVDLAWVECEVPLGSPERDLTYRRARAVHALVRARSSQDEGWSRAEVESLLTDHYGESAEKGLATQHRVLSGLDHPHDLRNADGLFVGCESPLPSRIDEKARDGRKNRDDGYAKRHLIDEWESWVAEGQHHAYTASPRPSSQQRIEPLRQSVPSPEVPRDAGDAAPQAAPSLASETLGPMLAPPVGSETHSHVIEPLAPSETHSPTIAPLSTSEAASAMMTVASEASGVTTVPVRETASGEPTSAAPGDAPLFDLSGPRRDASAAPANSLSSLLRPSYTTTGGPGPDETPEA